MRHPERKMTGRAEIDEFIRTCQVCRLGMVDGDEPYIVPMVFGYDGKALYFHSATAGRKIECLKRTSRVCFEFDQVVEFKANEIGCAWSVKFRSVMGTGTAMALTTDVGKRLALAIIMKQYSPADYSFPDDALAATAVFRVEIDSISGKRNL